MEHFSGKKLSTFGPEKVRGDLFHLILQVRSVRPSLSKNGSLVFRNEVVNEDKEYVQHLEKTTTKRAAPVDVFNFAYILCGKP